MADDIVTRLRAIASRCWCAEKSQGEPVGKPFFRCESCDNQLRAADHIERLQTLVRIGDDLAYWLEDYAMFDDDISKARYHIKCWKHYREEARRG